MKHFSDNEYWMYRHGDSEWGKADWVIKNSMDALQKTDFKEHLNEYRKFWGYEFSLARSILLIGYKFRASRF